MKRAIVLMVLALALGISGAAFAKDEGWLGVMLQPLTDELRDAMNIGKDVQGVLVTDVVAGSPADSAGVAKGDVIVEIGGKAIGTTEEAISQVKSYSPGDKINLVIVRKGAKETLTAVLGKREAGGGEQALGEKTGEEKEYYNVRIPRMERIFKEFAPGPAGYLGVKVQDISSDLGQYFGVGEGEGVLVLEVTDDGPAARAGLRAGDVITKVDNNDVTSTGDLVDLMKDSEPGSKVDITFKRNKETRRLEVEVGKANLATRIFMKRAGMPGEMGSFGMMRPGELQAAPETMEPGQPGEGMMRPRQPGYDCKHEIDQLKQEIDDLKKEIDSLKK